MMFDSFLIDNGVKIISGTGPVKVRVRLAQGGPSRRRFSVGASRRGAEGVELSFLFCGLARLNYEPDQGHPEEKLRKINY